MLEEVLEVQKFATEVRPLASREREHSARRGPRVRLEIFSRRRQAVGIRAGDRCMAARVCDGSFVVRGELRFADLLGFSNTVFSFLRGFLLVRLISRSGPSFS
jgi:hypothetical protein